jgi:hypothetical protein
MCLRSYMVSANRAVAPEGTGSLSVLLFCACWSCLPTTQPRRPALGSYRIASSHLKPRVGREYLPAKTPGVVEMAVGIAILTALASGSVRRQCAAALARKPRSRRIFRHPCPRCCFKARRFGRRGQSRPEVQAPRRDPPDVSRSAPPPTCHRRTVRGSQHPRTPALRHLSRPHARFRPKWRKCRSDVTSLTLVPDPPGAGRPTALLQQHDHCTPCHSAGRLEPCGSGRHDQAHLALPDKSGCNLRVSW